MDLYYKDYIVSYFLDIHDIDLENYNMETFPYLDEMTTFISKINKFIDNKKALAFYIRDALEYIIKYQYSEVDSPEELIFNQLIDVEVKNADEYNQALIYALKEEIKYYLSCLPDEYKIDLSFVDDLKIPATISKYLIKDM